MATSADELRDMVHTLNLHSEQLAVHEHRVNRHDDRLEQTMQQIARVEGRIDTAEQNTKAALDRLFGDLNTIKGGILVLKWATPLTIAIIGGVSTWILTHLLGA